MSHAENLARVSRSIGAVVLEFCAARIGCEFHMGELLSFVRLHCEIAPDSPSRILRTLRQEGLLSYSVVSRAKSLYRVDGVAE